MTERVEELGSAPSPVSSLILKAVGLAAAGGAIYLLGSGSGGSITAGVLLGVVALAVSAVLFGSGAYGPTVEGRLDLSARLGLGFLGGGLGALASRIALWVLDAIGLREALGVAPLIVGSPAALAVHLGVGAIWGMVLGVVFFHVPMRTAIGRGMLFSIVPSLYVLLKVYPVDYEVGIFGTELGALAFVFVFFLNLVWGSIAGGVVGWGDQPEEAPVARSIEAPRPIDA
jgi:hypothetical protein